MKKKCEASAMALAVFDDHLPICNETAEVDHYNENVTYSLCRGCHVALSLVLGIGASLS